MIPNIKIKGRIGSWFATAGEKSLPIMWYDQFRKQGEKFVIETDWLENARTKTANKRQEFIDFFEPRLGENAEIILANAKNPNCRPREIKDYVGVFGVKVVELCPEIKLEIIDRVAHSRT
jgi:hypothetical protein